MNEKMLFISFLVGLGVLSISINKAQQAEKSTNKAPQAENKTETEKTFTHTTPLKNFNTILEVRVICSKGGGNIKTNEYKPKQFQKKYAVQYKDSQGNICHVLPGFTKKEEAQIASGSLLLYYLGEKPPSPKKGK